MKNIPKTPIIVELLRNASEQELRQRLDELDGERDAISTLLRSVQARNRARRVKEGRRDD